MNSIYKDINSNFRSSIKFLSYCSVIFGRGEPTRKHPGNVVLRNLVRQHLETYMTSSKSEKSSIIRRVIREIDDSGARYLVPLDTSCRQTIFTGGCREARKSEGKTRERSS